MSSQRRVYLMRRDDGYYKIGISNNCARRARTLSAITGFKVVVIAKSPRLETQNARALESRLHDIFSDYRMLGEWFSLSRANATLAGELLARHDGGSGLTPRGLRHIERFREALSLFASWGEYAAASHGLILSALLVVSFFSPIWGRVNPWVPVVVFIAVMLTDTVIRFRTIKAMASPFALDVERADQSTGDDYGIPQRAIEWCQIVREQEGKLPGVNRIARRFGVGNTKATRWQVAIEATLTAPADDIEFKRAG